MTNDLPRPEPWWSITPTYARQGGCLAVLAMAGVQLSTHIGSASYWWLELPIHFQTQQLILTSAGALLLLYAMLRDRRGSRAERIMLLVALGTMGFTTSLLLGLTPAMQALKPPDSQASDRDLGRLRLLSANVHTHNRNHQAVLDLIAAEDPDVVLLMELDSQWIEALTPLTQQYPFHQVCPDDSGNFGIGWWSRLPVEQFAFEDFGTYTRQVQGILRLPGPAGKYRIRFIGVHPLPPKSADYAARRNQVFDGIANHLASHERLPTIVAGDMNSSRYAPRFQAFCRNAALFDAGYDAWGRTWPAGLVFSVLSLRIDHVLIDGSWRVRSFRTGPDIGSDHYPLIVDLQLTRVMSDE